MEVSRPLTHGRCPWRVPFPTHVCHWHTAALVASLSLSFCIQRPCREASLAQWLTDRGWVSGFPFPAPSGPRPPEPAAGQPSPSLVPGRPRVSQVQGSGQALWGRGGMLGLPRGWASSDLCSGLRVLPWGPAARCGPGTHVHNLATAEGQQAWP